MKVGSVDINIKTKVINFFACVKTCDREYKAITYSKFVRKFDRRYFNMKYDKNNNIIVVLYKMEHFGHF